MNDVSLRPAAIAYYSWIIYITSIATKTFIPVKPFYTSAGIHMGFH